MAVRRTSRHCAIWCAPSAINIFPSPAASTCWCSKACGPKCAYLLSEAERAGSLTFSIPFSRIQLADYLNCDRSALSRELSQMQRDGLLDTYKSSFKLLEPEVLKQMVQ